MSKIPFLFRPIPDEFLSDDFIDDPIMMRFIRWMFKRISSTPTKISLKNNRRFIEVELEPFEFIYGRETCSTQSGISLKNARNRIDQLLNLNYLEKVENKTASTYTVYRLVTTSFKQNMGQQLDHQYEEKGQQLGQQFGSKNGQQLIKQKHSSSNNVDGLIKNIYEEKGQQIGQQFGIKKGHNVRDEEFKTIRDEDKTIYIKDDTDDVKPKNSSQSSFINLSLNSSDSSDALFNLISDFVFPQTGKCIQRKTLTRWLFDHDKELIWWALKDVSMRLDKKKPEAYVEKSLYEGYASTNRERERIKKIEENHIKQNKERML